MIVYEGTIITVDNCNSVVKYLVEDGGRILYVGNDLPIEYSGVNRQFVKALLPAFADTHQHFASFACFNAGLNVMQAESNKHIQKMIQAYVGKCNDKLLIAFGASPYSVREGRLITRDELDAVTDERPFFMVKYDGHACVVNTSLLNKIESKVKHLRGYHGDTGEMNQEAFFAVSDYITKSIPISKLVKNMQKAIDDEAKNGIGLIHSVSGVGFIKDLDIDCEKMFAKSLQHGFQMRVFPQSMKIDVAKKRNLVRIGGCFKCALDGCFGSMDAAMIKSYENDSLNSGILYYTDEEVIDFCKEANRAGLQIEMHAIGDRAFEQATKALKIALDEFPREDHRHGIIHACVPTEESIKICRSYHIQLLMQISFDNWKQEPQEYINKILGDIRGKSLNPLRLYRENDIIISLGSDAPCTCPNPIEWLYKAVNHSNPMQAVTIEEAIRMCTYNGYWACFDEQERGSLEVGKIADMVILSNDPYEIEKEKLLDLKVEHLILNGKEYKRQKQSLMKILLKGLINNKKY